MDFTFSVKNFGKIKEANIQIKNLTVLAGQNNSGKTFVSKALYSIFSGVKEKDIINVEDFMSLVDKDKVGRDNLDKLANSYSTQHEIYQSKIFKNFDNKILKSNFKGNFQVSKLKQLYTTGASFNLGNFSQISFLEEEICSEENKNLEFFKQFSQVIYLESPIYLKLKPAFSLIFTYREQYITGIPDYFYKLSNLLNLQSKEEPKFSDILNKIEKSIGGKLKLSEDGTFSFKNEAGAFPITTTALGIANLGLLALLLEKNLLDTNSFLFIDEPEAHLHPQWQVLLIEVLYELAKAGVNIMIATHSIDMIKYIEVIWKQDKQAESIIALNCLTTEGKTIHEDTDFETKLDAIMEELANPFYNLYWEAL